MPRIFSAALKSRVARAALFGLAAILAVAHGPSASAAPGKPKAAPILNQPNGAPWPGADWAVSAPAGADAAKLEAALRAAAAPQDALGAAQAIVIVQNGRIVAERYAADLNKDARLNAWSVSNSITAALIGRALQTGAIKSLDEKAGLVEWKIAGGDRQNITIRNLLQMNSGLAWKERAAGEPAESDAEKMLFGAGQRDVAAYAAAKKQTAKAGERFVYSTGSSVLLSTALQRRLPPSTAADGRRTFALQKFISEELFGKLGMQAASPQFDIAGNFYAGSLIWAAPRDLARFGLFSLRGGIWNNERLLPEGWTHFMRAPSGAKDSGSYGAGFWIKAKTADDTDPLMAALPADAFAAGGDRGAVIAMIPSKDLVIVRLGIAPWGEKSRAALGVWLGQAADAFPPAKI